MRLLILLTLFGCLQATASSYGQTVSLDLHNESLEKALKEIKTQTGYLLIYTRAQLRHALPVTIQLNNVTVKDALDHCFENQPLSYTIEDKYVVIVNKPERNIPEPNQTIDASGKVVDENGNALLRITVTAVKSKKSTFTNEKGEFTLKDVLENDILVFTSVGYGKVEIAMDKKAFYTVTMKLVVGLLDETVIMAYGKTTGRLNTGNIGKVSSEVISQQPILDPLAALHGKVPGLVVTQTSGMPGGSIKIQIRGQSSLAQGSEPLIIVDGVPFAANNQPVNNLFSILTTGSTTGLSPIASINPLDIESIEVLKDADATAIYGSRGANGVVLITTKKGTAGRTQIFANFYTGWSKVPKLPQMLNTSEYLMMRREAITNDGFTPSADPTQPGYAPDLFIWDTTRETNFAKMMLGNNAHSYNGQVGFSGGNQNIQFFLSSGFNKEGTVFPGNMGTKRISFSNNIKYISENKKLFASLSTNYSNLKSNLINATIPSFLSLPPNAPPLYKPDGKLNWEERGYYFDNPMAYLRKKYAAATDNLLSNLQLEYKILKELSIRSSFGYNSMQVSEKSMSPVAAQIPIYNPTGRLSISDNSYKNWIIEPQIEYQAMIGRGELKILIGSTFSQYKQNSLLVEAEGYQSDNLLNSLNAATAAYNNNSFSNYKYTALFGRINYNWDQKYIVNITGRRDGSSRFGPGKRFANFGAIGAGWLFNQEKFIQSMFPFLSFGKIRTSYGLTGNDQIGNYKYLDAWSINNYTYQGGSTLYPAWLYNPLYGWETNKKFEVALDIGLFNDRIFLSSAYFNNRSGNQLVAYDLSGQTGFTSIVRNFPAIVQNSGIEFQLISSLIKTTNFKWLINANISIPSNKLLSFKELTSSSYSGIYVEGKSLNLIYQLNSLGVDTTTGVFRFEDINKDNTISLPRDLFISGNTDPRYYGGIRNTFTFKAFELDIFFDFKKQTGLNYLNSIYSSFGIPGFPVNQPKYVLDRWEEPGDITEIQRFTTIPYSDAYMSKENLRYSNAIYSDASYLRLKTASLSWQIPATIFRKVKMYNSKLFVSAQNIFTISKYKGTDPETQNFYALPTLRTIAIGINLNF